MATQGHQAYVLHCLVTCRVLDLWSETQGFNSHQDHVDFLSYYMDVALELICNAIAGLPLEPVHNL